MPYIPKISGKETSQLIQIDVKRKIISGYSDELHTVMRKL